MAKQQNNKSFWPTQPRGSRGLKILRRPGSVPSYVNGSGTLAVTSPVPYIRIRTVLYRYRIYILINLATACRLHIRISFDCCIARM